ncbi:hypothetical protein hrd7_01710 [Leptolinea sp. HRD-7]|nr:hypothetical protein hrd7_01710 [Leptolinea sp. HRD-7]
MRLNSRVSEALNRWPVFILIGLFFFGLLIFAVYSATETNLPGTDFFIYYVAARQVTIEHGSPYAETVGEQSQLAILKHLSRPGEDQLRYVYPPYGLLPVLPLSGLSIRLAYAVWLSFWILCLPIALIYAFRTVPPLVLLNLLLLYPLTFGLMLGNLNIAVICIILLVAGRLPGMSTRQKVEPLILGFFFAWATVKPQFSSFFILVFVLTAFRKQIWRFIAGFITGVVILIITSFFITPQWITEWLNLIRRYPAYTGGQVIVSPLVDLFPAGFHTGLYLLLVIFAGLFIGWQLICWWKNRCTTIELLCLGTGTLFLFHPTGVSYEQMTFLLPFVLYLVCGWQKQPTTHCIVLLTTVFISWLLVYLSISHLWDRATYYGMYFLFLIWLVFTFIFRKSRILLPGEQSYIDV